MEEIMLKYDELGKGLPVVLLHGFPLCRQMWAPQMAALADAGYRVICPDLPGFGESSSLSHPASMPRYADSVIDLLDELGIDQAVVGGMSMGGYVLLDLVERYPKRLPGAMFLVTRAAADDAAGKQKRTMMMEQVMAGNALTIPQTFVPVLFAEETSRKNPRLILKVRQWVEAAPSSGLIGGLLAMRERDDAVDKLPGFTLPSLVIGAEQDLAVPLEHSRLLAQGLPNSRLTIIPGAGHMANLEQPELFSAALLDFLASLS
jgi:pimeloyl-ACP methyl ester carboxylesterase